MKKKTFWMSKEEYDLVIKKTPIPCVNLVILRKNTNKWEVLLLVRKTGYAKGNWCIIGGGVGLGESVDEAIQRHVSDLGIRVKIISPFNPNFPVFVDDRDTQDKTKHPICLVFPVKIISGQIREEGEEYKGYKWFPADNLPIIAYGQKLQIQKTLEQLKRLK